MQKMPATSLTKPLFLAAVVLPMVTPTTAALADDDKTYVGAACRAVNPATAVLRPEDGALMNIDRLEQTWICPVVRDNMKSDPAFARITVQEDGISKVSCEFEARDPMGKSKNVSNGTPGDKDVQINPPLVVQTYTWGAGGENLALNGVADHGYYFFRCVIPGKTDQGVPAGVITYKVGED